MYTFTHQFLLVSWSPFLFFRTKPDRKPKMLLNDQMTSGQFDGWKRVTTS